MNMGNLVLRGRSVSLYDILNIPKDLYLLVKKTNGRVTKIESHDVMFLEKAFPKTGEVEKYFQLYEMENLDYGAISHSVEDLDETFDPPRNSRSDILSIPTLMEQDHE